MRFLPIVVLALFILPCAHVHAGGAQVWGMDADELSEELRHTNYEALREINFSRHRIEEAERLGDDASFALGLIFLDLGDDEAGEQLLHHAVRRAPQPWQSEAFNRLAAILSREARYDELEALARSVSESPESVDVEFRLLEALYRLERFDEVLSTLEEVGPRLNASMAPGDPRRAEAALWRAISLIETGSPGWPDAVRELYLGHPAAHAHSRVWVYLIHRQELMSQFTREEVSFFRAKQLLSEGRAAGAAEILTEALTEALSTSVSRADAPAGPLLTERGIVDLYVAGLGSRRYRVTAEALRAAAPYLDARLVGRAYEYAGRLYSLSGAHAAAVSLFERSLEKESDAQARQRIVRHHLSSRVRSDPLGIVSRLEAIVPLPGDPRYYSDIFAELAGLLSQQGRWDLLHEAYEAIRRFAAPEALARYEITIARAIETGQFLPSVSTGRDVETLRRHLLESASSQRGDRFAALLAATLLGEPGEEVLGLSDASEPPPVGARSGQPSTRAAALAATYLRFGLMDELFATIRAAGADVGPGVRIAAADRLWHDGDARRAILVMSGLELSGGMLTRQTGLLRYPAAFSSIVDERTAAEGVDPAVFYALVREESLFDPEISSSAGAVGLAQLMPATAADIAARMRLESHMLTDPADSLAIGARYFSMLSAQFGSVARAIAAYNAGQGNVRRWERRFAEVDDVLLHQTIPFPETYEHVRKVVVSAAYYAYLYDGRAPRDTVRLVFGL